MDKKSIRAMLAEMSPAERKKFMEQVENVAHEFTREEALVHARAAAAEFNWLYANDFLAPGALRGIQPNVDGEFNPEDFLRNDAEKPNLVKGKLPRRVWKQSTAHATAPQQQETNAPE
jgi:hypothetical protein